MASSIADKCDEYYTKHLTYIVHYHLKWKVFEISFKLFTSNYYVVHKDISQGNNIHLFDTHHLQLTKLLFAFCFI